MGIIKKQTIQSTIYTYIGVGIGFVNTVILMPNLLDTEKIGLLSLLNSFSSIFASIFTLGIPLITIKLFPKFRDEGKGHNGYFGFTLLMTIIGIAFGILMYFLFESFWFSDKNSAQYFTPFALGFTILFVFRVISKNFDTYIRMLYNTVLGAFLESFVLKIIVFFLLGAFWWVNGFDFKLFFFIYIAALAMPGLISFVYVLAGKDWSMQWHKFKASAKGLNKQFLSLGLFGLLGTLGSIIVLEVDKMMISNMIGLSDNGIYTIAFFFGVFVNIPARGVKRVASVVISDAWKSNELHVIKSIYRKSCINLLLVGVYLFLGVWLNIDYVFQFIPPEYSAGKYVILYIGLGQLFDMLTGVNTEIIASSKYYRYNTYFISSLIVFVIVFNLWLIPIYGITGAAMASAIAMVIYNLVRFVFLNGKLNFQPLNSKSLITVLLGLVCYAIMYYLFPLFDNPYWGIMLTGGTLTIIYWLPAYLLKVSEDVNQTINNILNKLR